jgi:hypothetical protein
VCVEEEVVSAGLKKSRVDKAGKPACEQCGTRLSRCKGKLHLQSPGHVCTPCYKKSIRPASSAASTSSPPPPKRRRVASDPGQLSASTQHNAGNKRVSAPIPLSITPPAPYSFSTHGWMLHKASRSSVTISSTWNDVLAEVQQFITIRGEMQQTDTSLPITHCERINTVRIYARAGTESLMRSLLRKADVEEQALTLSEMQLVRSPPGCGLQKPHYDIEDYEAASQSYVCILYCTDTMSTAVCVRPLTEMRCTFTEAEDALDGAALAMVKDPSSFISQPVEAGQALLMRCDSLHNGIENTLSCDRVVVFGLFVPAKMKRNYQASAEVMRYPGGAPKCPNEEEESH